MGSNSTLLNGYPFLCIIQAPQVRRLNARSSLLPVDPHGRQARHLEAKSSTLYIIATALGRFNFGRLQGSPGGIRSTSLRGRKYPNSGSGNLNSYSEEKRSEVSPHMAFAFGLLTIFWRRPSSSGLNTPGNRKKTRVKGSL